MNKIQLLALEVVGDFTIKLASVGSGSHVIQYKVTCDGCEQHQATMHNKLTEARESFTQRIADAKLQQGIK